MYSFISNIKKVFVVAVFVPFYLMSQPTGYYNGTEGLSGDALKTALHEIIDNHYFGGNWYNDAKYIFLSSDADPEISGNIIDVYSGNSMNGLNYGTQEGTLNREHVWAKSHGNFAESSPMYSDYHNLKPCESRINQNRSNLDFDWGGSPHPTATGCFYDSDSWEPRDAVKGDVARIIFYMATRYEGTNGELDLEVVDWVGTYPMPKHGKESALFAWNISDPPDDFERNRNNVIYAAQGNRNPFIDNPEWVSMIWGSLSPSTITIGNIRQNPALPSPEDDVEVSCTIENVSVSADVTIRWGTSYTALNNHVTMSQNGNIWTGTIPAQPDAVVYYQIQATENDITETSVCYNYIIATLIPITEIQGEDTESPYVGQSVQTSGVVTATFDNGYFIQDGTDPRSGIFVYDNTKKPNIGNLIMVQGTVSEYYGLTEISNIVYYVMVQEFATIPAPIFLKANEIGENYESMWVTVQGTCNQYAINNFWKIEDETGNISIHNNSVYSITPAMNQFYSINGILKVSDYGWHVELYGNNVKINEDFSDKTAVFPNPTKNSVFISFSESVSDNIQLDIFDISGRLYKSVTLSSSSNNIAEVDVSMLSAGVWNFRFSNEQQQFSKIIIIK